MKQCKKCDSTDLATRSNLCKNHHREYTREHYQRNKEYYKAKAKREKVRLNQDVQRIKGSTPCADCKSSFPYYVMDFDHLAGFEKIDDVNALLRLGGRKRVMDEIAKCELVCANCHRVRTHNRASGILGV